MALTDEQIEQYSRQIILPELGGIGQKRLFGSRALLLGHGTAFECAATYLVGAGVGTVELEDQEATVAFARLAERSGDVTLGPAPASPDLGDYDVYLDVSSAAPTGLALRGHARLGELRVHGAPEGIHLDIVPAETGCAACCAPAVGGTRAAADVDALQAGAMSALAAVLWAAEIADEVEAKRLTLAPAAPTWSETLLGPTASCPRPCRP